MLRNALQALQASIAEHGAAMFDVSPLRHIDTMIAPSAMAHLHAASPKATRGAFALVENLARCKGPRIANGDDRHQDVANGSRSILHDFVAIFVHNGRVAIVVRKDSNKLVRCQRDGSEGAESPNYHLVLLRDLTCSGDKIQLSSLPESVARGRGEAYCDCNAFTFRSDDEPLCKHVVVAAIAAILQLAPVTHVNEDDFLQKIGGAS